MYMKYAKKSLTLGPVHNSHDIGHIFGYFTLNIVISPDKRYRALTGKIALDKLACQFLYV